MSEPSAKPPPDPLKQVKSALRLVCAELPHLSGLASAVRIHIDDRVPTAGIAQTGRLLVNPEWFATCNRSEAAFIMAHELFHLCLQTHDRGQESDAETFNWAHDYIINDMLALEMDRPVPKGGLVFRGARELSAEKIMLLMKRGRVPGPKRVPRADMTVALEEAGLLPPIARDYGPGTNDVLSPEDERRMFPDANPLEEEAHRRRVRAAAAKAVSLGLLKGKLEKLPQAPAQPQEPERYETLKEALRLNYQPPWEAALQQWMEAVAPGPRSYTRPSRRGADRPDVVLPGRKREGWTLHVVLDTSGSMVDEIPRLLGAIAVFCESVNAALIHILQCDVEVTSDEWLDPEELTRYRVAGFGGSDMAPALHQLAKDPEVEAAIVITDGYISYPAESMPYRVLWALTEEATFEPPYGHVVHIPKR